MRTDEFRRLPSVDRLLQAPALADSALPRALLVDAARAALGAAREGVATGRPAPSPDALVEEVLARLREREQASLRPAINATGVIVHTNLGRAPVSDEAAMAMAAIAAGYSNLEFDLATGGRGSRHAHLTSLLREVTGAEDGIAVNNNAGAVLLALSALAAGREVVISRGQAVEIGGGFRIPDVMRQSGARLVEVGTTNRTYLRDYAEAITPTTALLLRVHPSNFRVAGFVHSVEIGELVALAREAGVAVMDDVGSGALLDPARFGLAHEPLVGESARAGADIVCFSGDKLLGGPQAGIVVGKAGAVERVRRHPLARALRIDKASLAGLEVTLRHYVRGEALQKVPIWRMIAEPAERLEQRAHALAGSLEHLAVTVLETRAPVGGGSLPEETLPSWAVRVASFSAASADALAATLRGGSPPIVGRVEHDALLLDLRTVPPGDDAVLRERLGQLLDRT
ncbi:MAG TPA: L-seryl-tRNA(Sec) selenium transferase [Chloroflexota bacterium]|nr:L-seryl-tRNA(Sec) selenium transferase [Chloroflexota bacterium]